MSSKSILINEKDLIKIKETQTPESNIDAASVDEFEVGSEGGANDFFHVNESYYNRASISPDEIDYVEYRYKDDPSEEGYEEDEYDDFVPYYEIEVRDRNGESAWEELRDDELDGFLGKKIADLVRNGEGIKRPNGTYYIDDIQYMLVSSSNINLNDVNEVNAAAKKISDSRGDSDYILTDGDVISFFDHRYISGIDGMTIAKFLDLGNIRVGHRGIELIKCPTTAQKYAMMEYIEGLNELYLDFSEVNGDDFYPKPIYSVTITNPDPRRVVNQICRYYTEGIKPMNENIEYEVSSSDVKLDSFKKMDTLMPKVWNEDRLSSKVRLKLLDISDDFWDFLGTEWVKRRGIYLIGSACNYNWSKYSDLDVHIVVDFSEVDDRVDFVREYYDAKKNEWNSSHDKLKIYGHTVELYVEDINDETNSSGVYDLEKNEWVREPKYDDISDITLNKYDIKRISAKIMTRVDDIEEDMSKTNDSAIIRALSKNLKSLLSKVRSMRKFGLGRSGEDDTYNIVYKVLRRSGYIDKMYELIDSAYDAENSIDESRWIKFDSFINEEVVADGSADTNPYKDRWKKERETLKNYLCNYGATMTSRENGKQYKVIYDTTLSQTLGINYCICIQWNPLTLEPGDIIYVRAYDKFTRRLFRPQFDTRGFDNVEGTSDDLSYNY